MDKKEESLRGIVFIDIKTGQASLSSVEKKIKETVEAKKIAWRTISLEF